MASDRRDSEAEELAALQCGDELLSALAVAAPSGLTVSGLAGATGTDRGLITRVVPELIELGFIERDGISRRLRLSWTFAALARRMTDARLRQSANPALAHLSETVGQSAYLVVRQGAEAVTVAESIPPSRSLQLMSWVGRSYPVSRSDAGPVLLSGLDVETLRAVLGTEILPQVEAPKAPVTVTELLPLVEQAGRDGFCVLVEQAEEGMSSVAARVRHFGDRVIAAVVVSGPTIHMRDMRDKLIASTVDAATAVEVGLGWDGGRE